MLHAVHEGDIPAALELVNECHATLHEQRRSLRTASEALTATAERAPEEATPSRGVLRIGELAHQLGLRPSALRVWEAAGLLSPHREPGTGYRGFGPAEIRDARLIAPCSGRAATRCRRSAPFWRVCARPAARVSCGPRSPAATRS